MSESWSEELERWTVVALRSALKDRDVETIGTKDILIERLLPFFDDNDDVVSEFDYWTLACLRSELAKRDSDYASTASTVSRRIAVARLTALDRVSNSNAKRSSSQRSPQQETDSRKKQRPNSDSKLKKPSALSLGSPARSAVKALFQEDVPSQQQRPTAQTEKPRRHRNRVEFLASEEPPASPRSIIRSPLKRRFTPEDAPKPSTPTKVNFKEVHIQEYERMPGGSLGVPKHGDHSLGLDWKVVAKQSTPVKEYEKLRKGERQCKDELCSVADYERERLLRGCGTPEIVERARKEVHFLRKVRDRAHCSCLPDPETGRCCKPGSDCPCAQGEIQCHEDACGCQHSRCANDLYWFDAARASQYRQQLMTKIEVEEAQRGSASESMIRKKNVRSGLGIRTSFDFFSLFG